LAWLGPGKFDLLIERIWATNRLAAEDAKEDKRLEEKGRAVEEQAWGEDQME
jgi:hypothetical protein